MRTLFIVVYFYYRHPLSCHLLARSTVHSRKAKLLVDRNVRGLSIHPLYRVKRRFNNTYPTQHCFNSPVSPRCSLYEGFDINRPFSYGTSSASLYSDDSRNDLRIDKNIACSSSLPFRRCSGKLKSAHPATRPSRSHRPLPTLLVYINQCSATFHNPRISFIVVKNHVRGLCTESSHLAQKKSFILGTPQKYYTINGKQLHFRVL